MSPSDIVNRTRMLLATQDSDQPPDLQGTTMATPMKNIDPNQDLAIQNDLSATNGVSTRKRGSVRQTTVAADQDAYPPPAAPEVPQQPPISYKQPPNGVNIPQGSFSQRAKGQPFAREALGGDGEWDNIRESAARKRESRRQSHIDEATAALNGETPLRTERTPRDGKIRRQQDVHSSPTTHDSSTPRAIPRDARNAENRPRVIIPTNPPARSNTLNSTTSAATEQRREWAPDRSPLQKLEVTLDDISKEEKRARVEEAEMLLRESKSNKVGKRSNRDTTSAAISPVEPRATRKSSARHSTHPEPGTLEEAGLVRNLSTTHKDRLNHSTAIETKRPDVRRLSGEGGRRGFDYEEQPLEQTRLPESSQDTAQRSSSRKHRASDGVHHLNSTSQRHRRPHDAAMADHHAYQSISKDGERSVSDPTTSLSQSQGVPSNITRAVSMQQRQPQASSHDEGEYSRANPARGVNTSHKAAIVGPPPTNAPPQAAQLMMASEQPVVRTTSKKLQKPRPLGQERRTERSAPESPQVWSGVPARSLRADTNRDMAFGEVDTPTTPKVETSKIQQYQKGMPKQVDVPRNSSQRIAHKGGSITQQYADAAQPIATGQESTAGARPRQQSVSFQEPADRSRIGEDWRNGGVAKLEAKDLALGTAAAATVAGPSTPTKDKAWWESSGSSTRKKRHSAETRSAPTKAVDVIDDRHAEFNPPLYLKCGPLLRYCGMKSHSGREIWRGSVLIVTKDSMSSYQIAPSLRLFSQPRDLLPPAPERVQDLAPEYVDPIAGLTKISRTGRALYVKPVDHLEEGRDLSRIEDDTGLFEESPSPLDGPNGRAQAMTLSNKRLRGKDGEQLGKIQEIPAVKLYSDAARDVTFWRFNLEIEVIAEQAHIAYRINRGPAIGFWVPAKGQSMNMMFHSCNGFSLSVKSDEFSGPDPLWRDVLTTHQTRPFHVMIGGGDQIYNDRITTETTLFREWVSMKNPHHKHHMPFSPEMRNELESFYLERYAMWFSQGLFGVANSQIPMVNIWDDHDIIDGFGSYPDNFMRAPVFQGVGEIAFKYYLLFQHQSVPKETAAHEPSWLLGAKPGPYIHQLSRSVFMHMGRHIAFLGLDCRTERMRDEILTEATYDTVLERCRKDIIEGETKHLIVLLGVPIAYPRLVWLENVLTSRAMDPVKALGRLGMFRGGFLNKFDGGVEILDDLDDHWTATNHKQERNYLIEDLQDLAAEKSVRITILGGDVHLAAIGQFYSNPKLKIPKDKDHRYMPNIISSAIVNTPPPDMMADTLNKRNKVHHLDQYTDEDMIPMFTHDVDGKNRNNKRLLPRRNWCSIREYNPGSTPVASAASSITSNSGSDIAGSYADESYAKKPKRSFSFNKGQANPRNLFRRMSSRGKSNMPPTSFRGDQHADQRYFSDSNVGYGQRPGSQGSNGSNQPVRTSFDNTQAQHNRRRISLDGGQPPSYASNPPSVGQANSLKDEATIPGTNRPIRPGNFQRRPTNLSETAARKGDPVNEFHDGITNMINDHINLEGGLDIVLNCEVNQKDPAGITVPYRLLVPALWYDGTSDQTKLEPLASNQKHPTKIGAAGTAHQGDYVAGFERETPTPEATGLTTGPAPAAPMDAGAGDAAGIGGRPGLGRKPTLRERLGFGRRQNRERRLSGGDAGKQGAGNWGQESDTESNAESDPPEHGAADQKPKRGFGGLGSLFKRRNRSYDSYDSGDEEELDAQGRPMPGSAAATAGAAAGGITGTGGANTGQGLAMKMQIHDAQHNSLRPQSQSRGFEPRVSTTSASAGASQPVASLTGAAFATHSGTNAQHNRRHSASKPQDAFGVGDRNLNTTTYTSDDERRYVRSQEHDREIGRYPTNSTSATEAASPNANRAYHSNMTAPLPPTNPVTTTHTSTSTNTNTSVRKPNRLTKQQRVLGLGVPDTHSNPYAPAALQTSNRSPITPEENNGRYYGNENQPPQVQTQSQGGHFTTSTTTSTRHYPPSAGRFDSIQSPSQDDRQQPLQRTPSGRMIHGYDGVDAFREKPKRRFSLTRTLSGRSQGKNWIGSDAGWDREFGAVAANGNDMGRQAYDDNDRSESFENRGRGEGLLSRIGGSIRRATSGRRREREMEGEEDEYYQM